VTKDKNTKEICELKKKIVLKTFNSLHAEEKCMFGTTSVHK